MKTGVWLDKEKAYIVTLDGDKVSFITTLSNIENFRIHGGSGTKFKGGPQDVIQDSKYLEREKHQFKAYFKNLISEINDADAIVLFGPAETAAKFHKELIIHHRDLSTKIMNVLTEDSMTKRQVIAWVKNFFKSTS